MNPEIKQQWVEALRSGEYEQTIGSLHTTVEHTAFLPTGGTETAKVGYCCLGVLCDLAAKSGVVQEYVTDSKNTSFASINDRLDHNRDELPKAVIEWAGVESSNPSIDYRLTHDGILVNTLAEANDQGVTFEEIAQIIEEEL